MPKNAPYSAFYWHSIGTWESRGRTRRNLFWLRVSAGFLP